MKAQISNMDKVAYAPLINLGCKSEMAWFGNYVIFCAGSESVRVIARKRVLSTNGLLVSLSFVYSGPQGQNTQFNRNYIKLIKKTNRNNFKLSAKTRN